MAIIKCKMCGGELILIDGASTAECEFCGSVQTIPNLNDEKKLIQFERAERLRKQCEFDKAAGIYETIVADYRQEAEAYWGLVLCKYGIEYVDDPATGKKIPTCHRSSFDAVMDDSNFEQAMENADEVALRVYRQEAKQIEGIRKGILEVSSSEKPYDIFICYKETDSNGDRTVDSLLAQDIYDALTSKGYRVFFSRITLEDKLGQAYEPYIFAALNSAKIMLAVGTCYEHYNAVWVKNEWSRYLKIIAHDKNKYLIPCYRNIDAYDIPKEFAHLQGQDMGKVGAIQDLLRGIEKILPLKTASQTVTQETIIIHRTVETLGNPSLRRAYVYLEDGNWQKAKEYFEEALDLEAENAYAYLGLMLVQLRLRKKEKLKELEKPFDEIGYIANNYKKIIRFADETLTAELNSYLYEIKQRINERQYCEILKNIENAKTALRFRMIAKDLRKISGYKDADQLAAQCEADAVEAEKREAKKIPLLKPLQERAKRAGSLIVDGGSVIAGVKTDGRLCFSCADYVEEDSKVFKRWNDLIAITTIAGDLIGVQSNGTVVTTIDYDPERNTVSNWKDIEAISCSDFHVLARKTDGTVVAAGHDDKGQCDVKNWNDIVSISASTSSSIGVKSDGSVVIAGDVSKEVSEWSGIVSVASCFTFVGLRSDGTVLNLYPEEYQESVNWTDIVDVCWYQPSDTYVFYIVGLKSDGTVVIDSRKGPAIKCNWTDIIALAGGEHCLLGVKTDGTVVAIGDNDFGQCDAVADWKLFENYDNWEMERQEACAEAAKWEEERGRLEAREKSILNEIASLSILQFKRRKELEKELTTVLLELDAFEEK